MVWRVFSATSSSDASNRTEFHPASRQMVIHSRSGQWSRCSDTGTGTSSAQTRHMLYSALAPIDFTVLSDVWTMSGDSISVAAASTASSVRSSTTLIAATPYLSAKAGSRIWRIGTTGISQPPSWPRPPPRYGCGPEPGRYNQFTAQTFSTQGSGGVLGAHGTVRARGLAEIWGLDPIGRSGPGG